MEVRGWLVGVCPSTVGSRGLVQACLYLLGHLMCLRIKESLSQGWTDLKSCHRLMFWTLVRSFGHIWRPWSLAKGRSYLGPACFWSQPAFFASQVNIGSAQRSLDQVCFLQIKELKGSSGGISNPEKGNRQNQQWKRGIYQGWGKHTCRDEGKPTIQSLLTLSWRPFRLLI